MNRKPLLFLMFLDLGFLGGMGFRIWSRYQDLQGNVISGAEMKGGTVVPVSVGKIELPAPVVTEPVVIPATSTVVVPEVSSALVSVQTPLPIPNKGQAFRRTFVLHNPTAVSVQLVGDFNQWTPQAFHRGAKGRWSVSVKVAPGDYSYNFIVDGQTIRDPNQRRTDVKGRSLLTVSS